MFVLENFESWVHWAPPLVVVIFIAYLVVRFWIDYHAPAIILRKDLKLAIDGVKSIKQNNDDKVISIEHARSAFLHNSTLLHLWNEYTETVHQQFTQDQYRGLKALRATVPAETFFNTAVIVDTKLNTEFFRHLPGILTGIGIIGTFAGLLIGLNGFSPETTNPEALSKGLASLMDGVEKAFIASALAIIVAMIVTGVEKKHLNTCYKQVEELAQAVDALYDAGAGEEYLRELVESSQQNQAHTAQLKDAMVNDLKTMLENLGQTLAQGFNSTMQDQMRLLMKAQQETNEQLVIAIQEGMKEPLDKVEKAITRLAGKQEDGVGELIGTAVKQIESMFGTKLDSFGQLLNTANDGLFNVVSQLHESIKDIQSAGDKMLLAGRTIEEAGNNTADKILTAGEAFTESSESLASTAAQVSEAAQALNGLTQQSKLIAEKLSDVKDVLVHLEFTVDKLKDGFEQTQLTYQDSSDLLRGQVAQVSDVLDKMKASIADFGIVSESMNQASTSINKAVTGFNVVVDQFNAAKVDVSGTSTTLTTVSQSLQDMMSKLTSMTSGAQMAAESLTGVSNTFEALKDLSNALTINANASGAQHEQNMNNVSEMLFKLDESINKITDSSQSMKNDMGQILGEIKQFADGVNTSVASMKEILVDGATSINQAGNTLKLNVETAATKIVDSGDVLAEGLKGSAQKVTEAASGFANVSANLKDIGDSSSKTIELVNESTKDLNSASRSVEQYLKNYEQMNQKLVGLVERLQTFAKFQDERNLIGDQQIEQMKELVGNQQILLKALESSNHTAIESMTLAQQEAAKFGQEVGGALTKAFESFTANLTNASMSNASAYQKELGQAVQNLQGITQGITGELNKIKKLANAAQRTD